MGLLFGIGLVSIELLACNLQRMSKSCGRSPLFVKAMNFKVSDVVRELRKVLGFRDSCLVSTTLL